MIEQGDLSPRGHHATQPLLPRIPPSLRIALGLLWDDTHGPTPDAYALAESPSPALTTTQRTILRVAIELFEAQEDGVVEVLREGVAAS